MTQDTRLFEKPRLEKLTALFRMMTDMDSDVITILSLIAYGMAAAVVYLSMAGPMPVLIGLLALGVLLGGAGLGILQTSKTETITETIEQTVPYNDWPDECYGCNKELGDVRGQLVIHKGEGAGQLKAVGLCEQCTRTHSTMLDYSDKLEKIYDMRGEPEEI